MPGSACRFCGHPLVDERYCTRCGIDTQTGVMLPADRVDQLLAGPLTVAEVRERYATGLIAGDDQAELERELAAALEREGSTP